eukprot:JP448901.1.p1 GENE.JP448901.1~~JP448901.1.p1  ORF type:complete len:62 (+),score=10.46 JP448901.1:35-220(+)
MFSLTQVLSEPDKGTKNFMRASNITAAIREQAEKRGPLDPMPGEFEKHALHHSKSLHANSS